MNLAQLIDASGPDEQPETGGASVGSLPRLVKRPGTASILSLVVGVSLLAVSRPFEGLVALIPVAAVLFWALGGHPR